MPTRDRRLWSKLESFIIDKMAETRIPGLSIAVSDNGRVAYSRGFGFRNIAESLPSNPETIYGVGSITKTITAIAVLQLVEKGYLSLNDTLESLLGISLNALGEPVRVRHLLSHSSGIPALGYAEAFIRGYTGISRDWLPTSGLMTCSPLWLMPLHGLPIGLERNSFT